MVEVPNGPREPGTIVTRASQEPLSELDGLELSVVVPTYNEARIIEHSLEAICLYLDARGVSYEVIVVDDGSTDGTFAVTESAARRLNQARGGCVRPLRADAHHGKGAAVGNGVLAARGAIVMYLDADLSIPIAIADDFLKRIASGVDAAIASRFIAGSRSDAASLTRRVLSVVFRNLVRTLLVSEFSDTQCGAKAWRREVAQDLFRQKRLDGFAFDAEVLYLAVQRGYRIVEVPFTLAKSNGSSVRFISHSSRMLCDLLRIRVNNARGLYR